MFFSPILALFGSSSFYHFLLKDIINAISEMITDAVAITTVAMLIIEEKSAPIKTNTIKMMFNTDKILICIICYVGL